MKNTVLPVRKCALLLALAGLLLPAVSQAVSDGQIEPQDGQPRQYSIKIQRDDIRENRVGYTLSRDYTSSGGSFQPRAYCSHDMSDAVYLKAELLNPTDPLNAGFLKLNDYISIKVDVQVIMQGSAATTHTVPFNDISNELRNPCTPPSTVLTQMDSGSRGSVTFKVTKPIINGLPIPGRALAQLYAKLGRDGVYGSQPVSRISIESAIITVPDKCIINSGTPITVDFGNIPSTGAQLNGSNFAQNIPIPVRCEGGSFDTGNFSIRLNVQQASPVFEDQKYLGVSGTPARPDLGIMLRDSTGKQIIPNTFYDMPGFTNNQGTWNLTAAPIAKTPTSVIAEGDFSASATVVAQFQ